MSLINYLGTFDTLTAIWEAYPEGGKEGDYVIIGGEYYQWDKYSASWSLSAQISNEAIVAEEDYFTPMRNGSDVIGDTSEQTNVFINFLGHFASLTEVWEVYPEGGKEGDYIIISEQRLWWNKYAQEWDNAIIASSDITDVEIDITLPSSCVNPLGRFDSLADAWRKHPEGGREGDYIQIAEDIYKWDKYLTAWINIKELPSSELMPIVPTFTEDVVEYSDGYINYIGTFDTLEQVWLVYPEGGKEGDYIIVDGERYRWNKLTNNWGEVDPDAETPARPVVSIFGDLHIHNDTVIGEKLYAEILNTFTTKRWIIEQGYLGVKDITPTLIMSNIVPDNVTIGIKDGKLVVIGGGTADSISWEDITNKPSWLEGEEGFVTISSEQTIRAHKNFEKGISVQGAPISYDAVKKVWIFDANMLVTGGLAWNSSLDGFKPETITDAVMIDSSTLGRNENGEIYVKGGTGGSGGGSIAYPLTWSGFSRGMWDGSASANIAIPSLMSQLQNDVEFITYASVNSLLTDYLPKSGGTMSDRIDFDKTYGSILTIRDGRYGQSAVISIGYTELEGDTIKLHIPTAGSYDEYFLLTHHQGATLTTDLAIYGKLHTKDSYRQLYHDSYNGQVAHSILNNSTSPYGLLTRIYGNGDVSLQAQRESTNNEYFNLLLNEYGGNVVIGGELHANDTISFVGSGNTAIQFPDGEYIDRYGNIVLPSTAGQWSVKQGSSILMNVKTNGSVGVGTGDVSLTQKFNVYGGIDIFETSGEYSGVIGLNRKSAVGGRYNPNFTAWQIQNHYGNIEFYEEGYGARVVMYGGGAALLQVHGNFLATGEVTQHSSLELKDVVDTRFLTLDELAELKPYSFYWKDGRDDKLHAGAVADYVMPILPEVISTDKDNIHSMNYANAAWVVGTSLTPYVSKHEEEIAQLKARVRYLEDKLKER